MLIVSLEDRAANSYEARLPHRPAALPLVQGRQMNELDHATVVEDYLASVGLSEVATSSLTGFVIHVL